MRIIVRLFAVLAFAIASTHAELIKEPSSLDQLDDYSLLCIFDQFNYREILELPLVCHRFHNLITPKFIEKKFGESVITLKIAANKNRYRNELVFNSHVSMVEVLEKHGHLIKSLLFNGDGMRELEISAMNHLIEEHTSQTLIKLALFNTEDNYLIGEANRTFYHVKSLCIGVSRLPPVNLRMHEIYPNIEELAINIIDDAPINAAYHEYNRMTKLIFHMGDLHANVDLWPLFERNPQIRYLELNRMPNLAHLQAIDEHLPNLETLNLQCNTYNCFRYENETDENIRLRHVKKFILSNGHHDIKRIPITFDRLEILRIDIARVDDGPIQLIRESTQLKELSLPILYGYYDFTYVIDAMANLPVLEKVTIAWRKYYDRPDLQRLLNDFKSLKEITFIQHDRFDRKRILSLASDEWRLTHAQDDHIPFVSGPCVAHRFIRQH